jgi:4-hydroxy-3-polyprenylbenzoate decarboxylase
MARSRNLREFVKFLEQQGKLYRFKEAINKDTELLPVYRVQMRGLSESDRKALLFENVIGAKGKKYDMSVLAGIYSASEDILALGMGCNNYIEMLEKSHQGLSHPIDPVIVERGAVQEEVHLGDELKQLGIDEFPVPVEEPGFSGMLRTGLPMITKDPESGLRNMGTYNEFFRSPDRMTNGCAVNHHAITHHWKSARRLKHGLPTAIVIGPSHQILIAASTNVPYGLDELAVAGGMAGAPVELVRCLTVPLEVPAEAEAVIEAVTSIETMEPCPGFAEYPGHVNVDFLLRPVMHVTAITHRKNAMFTPIMHGFPPQDANLLLGYVHSAEVYSYLKYDCKLPVEEVYCPQISGGREFCLVRVSEGISQEIVQAILNEAPKKKFGKYVIAVDSDINLHDPELLLWALSFRTQPKRDFKILDEGYGGLDPSAAPPANHGHGRMSTTLGTECSRVVINATRKWPYPPVALPRKEYMDRAVQIWRSHADLPVPRLREPWQGYTLGHWNDELQKYADLIVAGEYIKVGEEIAKLQANAKDEALGDPALIVHA